MRLAGVYAVKIGILVSAWPGGSGVSTSKPTEAAARLEAYEYALLFLDNDPARQRADVTLWRECWACNGAGRYQVKGKRSIFGTFKPCHVCKGDPLEFADYSITRE